MAATNNPVVHPADGVEGVQITQVCGGCIFFLPETLSSSLMNATLPLAVILIRPDQSGVSSFQSAALDDTSRTMKTHIYIKLLISLTNKGRFMLIKLMVMISIPH